MANNPQIPQSVIEAARLNEKDESVVEIKSLTESISEKEKELRYLKSDLETLIQDRRKNLKLSHRENAMWCLEVDADDPFYFLKTSKGVATCVAIKNNLPEVDAELKSKTASAVSWLYLNNEVGRIDHNDTRYYGVKDHFLIGEDGHYSKLNIEGKYKLENLREVKLR